VYTHIKLPDATYW